jgi:membrane-associated phospholipid phosphatase
LRLLPVIPSNASDAIPSASQDLPRSWNVSTWIVAAFVLSIAAAAVMPADYLIAGFLREHRVPGDLARFIRLAEVFAWGGTVALIILTAAVLDPRRWRVVPPLVISAFGAGIIADGLKLVIARLRPELAHSSGATGTFLSWLPLFHRDTLGHPYGHALQSFPSGHAATAVGLAVALATLYPRGRWLFAAFAALACFQRMEAQAHFASDVLAGAAIGCLIGGACQLSRWPSNWSRHRPTTRSIGEPTADA